MHIGVVNNETWAFFRDIYEELGKYHSVNTFEPQIIKFPVFRERLQKRHFDLQLRNFLKKNQIVFFEWASELLAYTTRLPKTTSIITRLHRYELYQWGDQIDWSKVDRIILVSEAKRREFNLKFPGYNEKILVIPESVNPTRFPYQPRLYKRNIGILGNLIPRKRVYELILGFFENNLHKEGFHLHIGGGAHPRFLDYYNALTDLPCRLGIEKNVHFYGQVENTPEFFRNIDVFVSNSYSEGLQVSPMEAIATGCYCLSHFWPGADELLPQENLFFTDGEFVEKLIEYDQLNHEVKIAKQLKLREAVLAKCDSNLISPKIRQTIEEIAG